MDHIWQYLLFAILCNSKESSTQKPTEVPESFFAMSDTAKCDFSTLHKAANGKYTTRPSYILLKVYEYYQRRDWIIV